MLYVFDTQHSQTRMKTYDVTFVYLYKFRLFCTVNIVNQKIKARKSSLSLSSFYGVEMLKI